MTVMNFRKNDGSAVDWNPDKWLAPRRVETPDIVADIAQFIDSSFTKEDFELLDPNSKKKAIILTERLEFIDHLAVVSHMMQRHKMVTVSDSPLGNGMIKRTEKYSIVIDDHDFAGFDFDVDALAIYLLLSCVDTVKGQPSYTNVFEWLQKKGLTECPTNWTPISDEYERDFGLSRRFREAFTVDCCKEIQSKLVENFAVGKISSQCIKPESAEAWNKRTFEERLQRIASELYSIRSRFTHTSFRYFSPDMTVSKSLDASETLLLQRANGPNLRTVLTAVVKYLASNLVINQRRGQQVGGAAKPHTI